jgi:hypothetical protein
MDEISRHELRIKYLDVLMRNGETLSRATTYADEMLDRQDDGSQKDAIAHALELTALEQQKTESSTVDDFSLEEQMIAKAYVAGTKLKQELKDKKDNDELSKVSSHKTNWKATVDNSKKVDTNSVGDTLAWMAGEEEENTEKSEHLKTAIENDEMAIPPKENFDFVNPKPVAEESSQDQPVMVDPKQATLGAEPKERPQEGIREKTTDQLGQSEEVPLRYEDRIKQAQAQYENK